MHIYKEGTITIIYYSHNWWQKHSAITSHSKVTNLNMKKIMAINQKLAGKNCKGKKELRLYVFV